MIPRDPREREAFPSTRKASARSIDAADDGRQFLTIATSCGVSFPDAAFYRQLVTESIRLVSRSEKEGRPDAVERGGRI